MSLRSAALQPGQWCGSTHQRPAATTLTVRVPSPRPSTWVCKFKGTSPDHANADPSPEEKDGSRKGAAGKKGKRSSKKKQEQAPEDLHGDTGAARPEALQVGEAVAEMRAQQLSEAVPPGTAVSNALDTADLDIPAPPQPLDDQGKDVHLAAAAVQGGVAGSLADDAGAAPGDRQVVVPQHSNIADPMAVSGSSHKSEVGREEGQGLVQPDSAEMAASVGAEGGSDAAVVEVPQPPATDKASPQPAPRSPTREARNGDAEPRLHETAPQPELRDLATEGYKWQEGYVDGQMYDAQVKQLEEREGSAQKIGGEQGKGGSKAAAGGEQQVQRVMQEMQKDMQQPLQQQDWEVLKGDASHPSASRAMQEEPPGGSHAHHPHEHKDEYGHHILESDPVRDKPHDSKPDVVRDMPADVERDSVWDQGLRAVGSSEDPLRVREHGEPQDQLRAEHRQHQLLLGQKMQQLHERTGGTAAIDQAIDGAPLGGQAGEVHAHPLNDVEEEGAASPGTSAASSEGEGELQVPQHTHQQRQSHHHRSPGKAKRNAAEAAANIQELVEHPDQVVDELQHQGFGANVSPDYIEAMAGAAMGAATEDPAAHALQHLHDMAAPPEASRQSPSPPVAGAAADKQQAVPNTPEEAAILQGPEPHTAGELLQRLHATPPRSNLDHAGSKDQGTMAESHVRARSESLSAFKRATGLDSEDFLGSLNQPRPRADSPGDTHLMAHKGQEHGRQAPPGVAAAGAGRAVPQGPLPLEDVMHAAAEALAQQEVEQQQGEVPVSASPDTPLPGVSMVSAEELEREARCMLLEAMCEEVHAVRGDIHASVRLIKDLKKCFTFVHETGARLPAESLVALQQSMSQELARLDMAVHSADAGMASLALAMAHLQRGGTLPALTSVQDYMAYIEGMAEMFAVALPGRDGDTLNELEDLLASGDELHSHGLGTQLLVQSAEAVRDGMAASLKDKIRQGSLSGRKVGKTAEALEGKEGAKKDHAGEHEREAMLAEGEVASAHKRRSSRLRVSRLGRTLLTMAQHKFGHMIEEQEATDPDRAEAAQLLQGSSAAAAAGKVGQPADGTATGAEAKDSTTGPKAAAAAAGGAGELAASGAGRSQEASFAAGGTGGSGAREWAQGSKGAGMSGGMGGGGERPPRPTAEAAGDGGGNMASSNWWILVAALAAAVAGGAFWRYRSTAPPPVPTHPEAGEGAIVAAKPAAGGDEHVHGSKHVEAASKTAAAGRAAEHSVSRPGELVAASTHVPVPPHKVQGEAISQQLHAGSEGPAGQVPHVVHAHLHTTEPVVLDSHKLHLEPDGRHTIGIHKDTDLHDVVHAIAGAPHTVAQAVSDKGHALVSAVHHGGSQAAAGAKAVGAAAAAGATGVVHGVQHGTHQAAAGVHERKQKAAAGGHKLKHEAAAGMQEAKDAAAANTHAGVNSLEHQADKAAAGAKKAGHTWQFWKHKSAETASAVADKGTEQVEGAAAAAGAHGASAAHRVQHAVGDAVHGAEHLVAAAGAGLHHGKDKAVAAAEDVKHNAAAGMGAAKDAAAANTHAAVNSLEHQADKAAAGVKKAGHTWQFWKHKSADSASTVAEKGTEQVKGAAAAAGAHGTSAAHRVQHAVGDAVHGAEHLVAAAGAGLHHGKDKAVAAAEEERHDAAAGMQVAKDALGYEAGVAAAGAQKVSRKSWQFWKKQKDQAAAATSVAADKTSSAVAGVAKGTHGTKMVYGASGLGGKGRGAERGDAGVAHGVAAAAAGVEHRVGAAAHEAQHSAAAAGQAVVGEISRAAHDVAAAATAAEEKAAEAAGRVVDASGKAAKAVASSKPARAGYKVVRIVKEGLKDPEGMLVLVSTAAAITGLGRPPTLYRVVRTLRLGRRNRPDAGSHVVPEDAAGPAQAA